MNQSETRPTWASEVNLTIFFLQHITMLWNQKNLSKSVETPIFLLCKEAKFLNVVLFLFNSFILKIFHYLALFLMFWFCIVPARALHWTRACMQLINQNISVKLSSKYIRNSVKMNLLTFKHISWFFCQLSVTVFYQKHIVGHLPWKISFLIKKICTTTCSCSFLQCYINQNISVKLLSKCIRNSVKINLLTINSVEI